MKEKQGIVIISWTGHKNKYEWNERTWVSQFLATFACVCNFKITKEFGHKMMHEKVSPTDQQIRPVWTK